MKKHLISYAAALENSRKTDRSQHANEVSHLMVEPYAIERLPQYDRSYDTTLAALNEYGEEFAKLWNEEKQYSGKPEIILDGEIIIPVKKER